MACIRWLRSCRCRLRDPSGVYAIGDLRRGIAHAFHSLGLPKKKKKGRSSAYQIVPSYDLISQVVTNVWF